VDSSIESITNKNKMKKIILAIILLTAFSGCYEKPVSSTTEGRGVEVELLFEKDGIKVYRFSDGGHYHYFTDRGETMSTMQSGKNYTEENISNN
jgi:hypothetical protein